ncbi:hypothetical protein [Pantoea agglomerans]|uniref:hypothetical protein n=1 Tax=Enterobacter agglomerans TaxID=549 RepID=UPI003C7C5871
MLFDAQFFTGCPTFEQYARRTKTRISLGRGLSVFAELALEVGMFRVPKGELMAQSGMSSRQLNYFGGVKGVSYILRKSFTEGRARMTTAQIEGLNKIGIGAITCCYRQAMLKMKENPEMLMRREAWETGYFVSLEQEHEGDDVLILTRPDGGMEMHDLSIDDMRVNDWVAIH